MNKKSKLKILMFLMVFGVIKSNVSISQQTLKFKNGGGPTGSGPSTQAQSVNLYYGSSSTIYNPPLKVAFSLSNQQFTSIEGNSNTPGIVFGGGTSTNNTVTGMNYYTQLQNVGNPTNGLFSTNGINPAINVTTDYGINITTYADALINSNGSNKYATSATVYYGDLTINFNRPVNNPIIHFDGFGGFYTSPQGSTEGFAQRYDLASTGYSLTRLAGSNYFSVNGNSVSNTAPQIGTSSSATSGAQGASGSVLVNGNDITTLTFKVYMRGDGNGNSWSNSSFVSGDNVLVSVSLASFSTSGTVFDDANGLTDNAVNGVGSNAGGLNVVLIDSATNTVIASAPVGSDGTYSFNNNVAAGKYSLEITTASATVGGAPPAVTLPTGWVVTGEHIGSGGGSDGTPDGMLKGVTVNGNIANANFGIEQVPTATTTDNSNMAPWQFNLTDQEGYRGILSSNSAAAPLSGNDPEDGAQGTGNTFIIQSISSSTKLFYNGRQLSAGDTIFNYQPDSLSMYGANSSNGVSFTYSSIDKVGEASPAVNYSLSSPSTLPIKLDNFKVKSVNCEAIVSWTGSTEINFSYYEVQQSTNGNSFTKVEDIYGKGSGSDYTSRFAMTNNGYVRLKMVDKDGTSSYSNILPINSNCGTNTGPILYPNPVSNILIVDRLNIGTNSIRVVSIGGVLVYEKQVSSQQVKIDAQKWIAGIYIVSVKDEHGKTSTLKAIKQ